MIKVLENEFYYLDNFQRVLDWIAERYADLLDAEELAFIAAFATLPRPARALFVRMVMRKGSLFRASKLQYPEIGCPLAAARDLLPTGWVVADPAFGIAELFELLVKPEIAEAFALEAPLKSARKELQLEALQAGHAQPRPFSQWYAACPDTVFAIGVKPLCDRLRLIFFGNLHQDWTEFVLSDLGLFRYEQVEFSPASRGFRSRRDVDDYLRLHACRERFDSLAPGSDELRTVLHEVLDTLPRDEFANDWLERRRQKLLFRIGQLFEKGKDWASAHAVYAGCRFPGARSRAMRVLEKDEKFEQAYALFLEAVQAPESEAERQHLLRIGPRLARRLGHGAARPHKAVPPARLDLALPMPVGEWQVEGVVLAHLQRADAPVFYVENTLANTLFGLLCWPAVFAAIPGAFFHPFHRGPADLYSPDFLQRRTPEFEACLARLDDGSHAPAILAAWDEKYGIQSPFVAWDYLDRGVLELALSCIPAADLKLWFRRMLHDVRDNRTGFPDLIQFFPRERRYRMIEVKGPGDRLQDNQLRWIAYFREHEMPVTVCYLQWQEAA